MKNRYEDWLLRISKGLSRKGLYQFLSREYGAIPHGADVLSVGAGGEVNQLLKGFAEKNRFDVLSFDIDPSRGPDLIGDICSYDFGGRQFDVIVMSEVLEHLHSPHLGIKNIYAALKENGRLLLTTPFILPLHDRPTDYYRFTRYGLAYLLREFRAVNIVERNSYFDAIDVLWTRLLVTETRSARLLSYLVIPTIVLVKRPLSWLLGKFIRTDAMTTGYVTTAIK